MGFWSSIFRRPSAMSTEEIIRHLYGGGESSAGVAVNATSAMQCAAVYACVRVLAESVAQLPLPVYRRLSGGGKVRSFNDPLHTILNVQPNEWQTAFEFREMMMGHLCLRGNAYAFVNRVAGGRVAELIPLHPDRVEVTQNPDYSLVYQYTPDGGDRRQLPTGNVWHLRGLSSNGYKGVAPIAMARESIGLALATEKHGAKLFSNGTQPSGILKHPKTLTPKARDNLKESFERHNAGLANSHGTVVLEEGMDWIKVGMSSEDSQFLETRKYQRSEIASIFRVPPHKIGDLERATFSNIEHQGIEFVTDTMLPWLRRIEQAVTRDLIPQSDRTFIFVEHLVEGLLRGDTLSRYQAYGQAIKDGWLLRNEARTRENLNPIDGLDTPLMPLNMAIVGEDGMPIVPAAPDPAPTPDPQTQANP